MFQKQKQKIKVFTDLWQAVITLKTIEVRRDTVFYPPVEMEVLCLAGLLAGCTVGFYGVSSSNSFSSEMKGKILIGLGCIIGALGLATEMYR